ncbi:hypothetical protein HKD37_15G042978 [Glycine soja]
MEKKALNARALAKYESRRDVLDSIISTSDSYYTWELRICISAFAHLCEILRYCHRVLVVVLRLQSDLLTKLESIPQDCIDERWKWFKLHQVLLINLYIKQGKVDLQQMPLRYEVCICLGALDGIYIAVTSSSPDKPIYRTRKSKLAINFLDGSLALYRGKQYDLKEWSTSLRAPKNRKEIFNYKHVQARNVIERCLGVLKKQRAILRKDGVLVGEELINVVGTIEPSNE